MRDGLLKAHRPQGSRIPYYVVHWYTISYFSSIEIKSILITEPKQEDSDNKKKPKKAKFTNKKNFELIEYDEVEPEYEVDNEDFIVPSASNFEVT